MSQRDIDRAVADRIHQFAVAMRANQANLTRLETRIQHLEGVNQQQTHQIQQQQITIANLQTQTQTQQQHAVEIQQYQNNISQLQAELRTQQARARKQEKEIKKLSQQLASCRPTTLHKGENSYMKYTG